MTDVWNFYLTQADDEPGIVFLDLGLKPAVPIEGLDQRVVLMVQLTKLRDNGMPEPEELERLNELEDYLIETLPEESVLFIARKTLAGRRDFYFYASNATLAATLLSQAMVGFPEYAIEIKSEADPDWTGYKSLYPSPREVETIRNHEVISALMSDGDQLWRSRTITHWIYFRTEEDRLHFCHLLESTEFHPSHETETILGREFAFGQVVIHEGTVDIESIDGAVLRLYDLAQQCSGDYDGWESEVVEN